MSLYIFQLHVMNKCIICNFIEHILQLLCLGFPEMYHLLYALQKIEVHSLFPCTLKLYMFYYKSDSICKTFTTYNPCRYDDTCLPYSLIKNTATQFLVGNLLRHSFDILHTWDTVQFEQYSINNLNVIYFDSKSNLLLKGWIVTSCHIISLVGGQILKRIISFYFNI